MVFMGSLEFSVYGQVARKSSRPKLCLPKSELCHPKFLVKSPEMLSHAARNFITLSNTLASLLHLYHAFFVSSKIKERDVIYHLFRACFVVHQELKSERYYKWAYTACFVSSSLKERGTLPIIPFVLSYVGLKNEICYTHSLLKKIILFLYAKIRVTWLSILGDLTLVSGDLTGYRIFTP